MNFQVNWETTANNGQSHGTWMPFNLSTGEKYTHGWTTCMGVPNFTAYFTPENRGGQAKNKSSYQYPTPCTHQAYESLGSWFSDLSSFGFSTMMYGNYWEYGWSCDGGPSKTKSAPRSLWRALLMPQVNPGSRYRCGKSTFKKAAC